MKNSRSLNTSDTVAKPHKTRKHKRMNAPLLTADLSDGKNVTQGLVKDFSVDGLKMGDISYGFDVDAPLHTVIVSKGRHHFKLVVKLRWQKEDQVGFRILDAPWKWIELNKKGQQAIFEEFGYNA